MGLGPLGHSAALLAALVGAPVGAAALLLRPAWREGLAERLGAAGPSPSAASAEPARLTGAPLRPLWLHAASAGEWRAALPLLRRLRAAGYPLLATATTVAGRTILDREVPDVQRAFAPVDHPWCIDRVLERARPAGLVLIEGELWPVTLARASAAGIPTVVVCARLSAASLERWQRLPPAARFVSSRLSAVGARSPTDAERFAALGVARERIALTGDLKLDAGLEAAPLAGELADVLGRAALLVAGSTHEGEEDVVIDAFAACRGGAAALVIAPRELDRVERVLGKVRTAGLSGRRRSAPAAEPLREGEVLVIDTLGELASIYARASLAFVGGTLVPRGGHNILEPMAQGVPVVFGPSLDATREAAELALEVGAGRLLTSAEELAANLREVLEAPAAARARGMAGREAVLARRGVAERSLALVEAVLSPEHRARPAPEEIAL